jgi:hypothetical protein
MIGKMGHLFYALNFKNSPEQQNRVVRPPKLTKVGQIKP